MAKRFTYTDKWKGSFMRGLKAPSKLLYLYVKDDCDHSGIWLVELDIAEVRIGEKLPRPSEFLKSVGDKIHLFDKGQKWFIPEFIEEQYGVLNPANRVHKSVINILQKNNLFEKFKLRFSPIEGAKEKDKEKDKEQDEKEYIKGKETGMFSITNFEEMEKQLKSQSYFNLINKNFGTSINETGLNLVDLLNSFLRIQEVGEEWKHPGYNPKKHFTNWLNLELVRVRLLPKEQNETELQKRTKLITNNPYGAD